MKLCYNLILIVIGWTNVVKAAKSDSAEVKILTAVNIVLPWKIGISAGANYNINHLSSTIYFSIANDCFSRMETYLERSYNLRTTGKIGIGLSFQTSKIHNSLHLASGYRLDAVKESLNNPYLPKYVANQIYWSLDTGILQQLTFGHTSGIRFLILIYYPILPHEVQYEYLNNMHIDLGISIRIK